MSVTTLLATFLVVSIIGFMRELLKPRGQVINFGMGKRQRLYSANVAKRRDLQSHAAIVSDLDADACRICTPAYGIRTTSEAVAWLMVDPGVDDAIKLKWRSNLCDEHEIEVAAEMLKMDGAA